MRRLGGGGSKNCNSLATHPAKIVTVVEGEEGASWTSLSSLTAGFPSVSFCCCLYTAHTLSVLKHDIDQWLVTSLPPVVAVSGLVGRHAGCLQQPFDDRYWFTVKG